MDELAKLREEIDEIDRQLVALFESRMNAVVKIGQYKRKNKLPVLNSSREQEVLIKSLNYLKDKTFEKPLEEFFRELMRISKEIQDEV
jgi:monofunctional chorismate mutase